DYCKIIGTAGSPAVNIYAINLLFIDEQMTKYVDKNILTEDEVLRQYPKAIRQAYEKFRKGKQDKRGTNPEWFIVPVTNGAAFTTSDGLPPLAYIIELLARIKKLEPMRDDYRLRRKYVYDRLTSIGLDVVMPDGAFYFFIKVPTTKLNSFDFCLDLVDKVNLAVVPGSAFSALGEGYFRISFAYSMETLAEACNRLEEYMKRYMK
ncbi:MAG: aminotransferase class I/II-fold pyridoxal phosphate-dependent enzyme, partial [Niallia sp.]